MLRERLDERLCLVSTIIWTPRSEAKPHWSMTTAVNIDLAHLARELELPVDKVQRTLELLDDGNTVPFITRFRKDQTGGLNEEQVQRIQREAAKERLLAERKATILRSIEAQGRLVPELASHINSARTLKWLEDVYLPFKPKKQTLATVARERGLEPLAAQILAADPAVTDLTSRAAEFASPETGLASVDEVRQGVRHILAEQFSERPDLRGRLRRIMRRTGVLTSVHIESAERGPVPSLTVSLDSAEKAIEAPHISGAASPSCESATATPAASDTGEPVALPNGVAPHASAEGTEPPLSLAERVAAVATVTHGSVTATVKVVPFDKKASRKRAAKERKRKLFEHAFKDYYDFRESMSRLPPHRVLAINRGERAKVLRVRLECNSDELLREAVRLLVPEHHPHREFLVECVRDALQRLVVPSLERELRRELADEAEEHAVKVFAGNLRKLLLQPPVRGRRVLAVDPAFRSGCKLVALDQFGNVLEHGMIHVIGNEEQRRVARTTLADFIRRQQVGLVAIGNGTACRETEQIVSDVIGNELKDQHIAYVIVNEAGASVYSTSQIGREELPNCDLMMRSAVSIGRRLLDPLSELVKINPANIGVGMYQHDVKAKHLRESLDLVVNSCVNFVGVDVNTASPSLLSYVSGLNQLTARRLYEYRLEHGPFRNREQFKGVPGIGEATYVQAAGFLKISNGDNPLDATWIHPESYAAACRVLEKLNIPLADLGSISGNGVTGQVDQSQSIGPSQSGITKRDPMPPEPHAPDQSGLHTATPALGAQEIPASEIPSESTLVPGAESERLMTRQQNEEQASDFRQGDSQETGIQESAATTVTPQTSVAQPIAQPARHSLADRLGRVAVNGLSQELGIGELTLRDILAALSRPGRDPRDDFSPPPFRTGIMKLDDLKPGMELQGTVLNVVDFGAFVDIGISDSALIHISKLADRYIRDPQEVVSVGDVLKVWVLDVDKERRRVSLTAIDPHAPPRQRPQRERKPRRAKPASPVTSSSGPPPASSPPRQRQSPPKPFIRPKHKHKVPPPKKPPKPVRPITPGMLSGKQPMRSFSDLLQYYEKKQQDNDDPAS